MSEVERGLLTRQRAIDRTVITTSVIAGVSDNDRLN